MYKIKWNKYFIFSLTHLLANSEHILDLDWRLDWNIGSDLNGMENNNKMILSCPDPVEPEPEMNLQRHNTRYAYASKAKQY